MCGTQIIDKFTRQTCILCGRVRSHRSAAQRSALPEKLSLFLCKYFALGPVEQRADKSRRAKRVK